MELNARNNLNSQCLICSEIYWNSDIITCMRCGGLCSRWPDSDTRYWERRRVEEHCAMFARGD